MKGIYRIKRSGTKGSRRNEMVLNTMKKKKGGGKGLTRGEEKGTGTRGLNKDKKKRIGR